MAVKFRLNRFEQAAAAAVIVTTWLCIEGALNAAEAYLMLEPISAPMRVFAVLGWAVATFGPLALAVLFRRLARRVSRPWLLHLLFLPGAYGLIIAGSRIMSFVVGDPGFDATLGGPVMQAFLLFLFIVPAYFVAAAASALKRSASA